MGVVTKDRIFGLDILRCIAILLVLFAHTSFVLPISGAARSFCLIYFGFTGVEIFFVLSGFLVGTIFLKLMNDRPFSLSSIKYFWLRRWFRTLPAYYLALLIYTAYSYFVEHQFVFADTYNLLYFVFLQNFVRQAPEFFRHAWSLSIEEWFYLLLPAWIWVFYKIIKIKNTALAGILACIIIITLLRVFIVMIYNPAWDLGVRMIVPLRLDSLMMGVLAAYIAIHHPASWKKYAGICFAAGLLITALASVWLYLDVIIHLDDAGFLSKTIFFNVFTTGIALCIPYMSMLKKAGSRIIGAIVTYISKISYSLYLFHIVIMAVYHVICFKLFLPDTILLRFVGAWVACIFGAGVMYAIYEKPFTNLRERFR